MAHPVVDEFGHSYEKTYFEKHIRLFNRSPLTNQLYTVKFYVVNYGLKHAITEFWNNAVMSLRRIPPNTPAVSFDLPSEVPDAPRRGTNAPPNSPTTPTIPRRRLHRRNLPWQINTNVQSLHPTYSTTDEDYTESEQLTDTE